MMCALFGATYAQTSDTIHDVGRDSDGDTWYLDTSLVVRPKPPADFLLIMPVYTKMDGRTLVFIFTVDCSDSTYQMSRAFTMNGQGEILWRREEKSRWANFTGYSGNAARIICRRDFKLPIVNDGKSDGR